MANFWLTKFISVWLLFTLASRATCQSDFQSCLDSLRTACLPTIADPENPTETECIGSTYASIITCTGGNPCATQFPLALDLVLSSVRLLEQKCETKYCYQQLQDCLGSAFTSNFHDTQNYDPICYAVTNEECYTSLTCYNQDVIDRYKNLFNAGCYDYPVTPISPIMINALTCFPFHWLDFTYPDFTFSCNITEVTACVDSQPTALFITDLLAAYASDCGLECSIKSAPILNSYVAGGVCSDSANVLTSIDAIPACAGGSVDTHVRNTCSNDVCSAGVTSCYAKASGNIFANNWCTNGRTTFENCLDGGIRSACLASDNSSLALLTHVASYCDILEQGNGASCYLDAMRCFTEFLPDQQNLFLDSNAQDTICLHSDTVDNCFSNALIACNGNAPLTNAVTELKNVLEAMCVGTCTPQKQTACLNAMSYFVKQILINPTQAPILARKLWEHTSCYSSFAKKCSNAPDSDVAVNEAVIGAIIVSISSTCNFTDSDVTVPAGCDTQVVGDKIAQFLDTISWDANLATDQFANLLREWNLTKADLESRSCYSASSTEGVTLRLYNIITAIDNTVNSICNPSCKLREATELVSKFEVDITAALSYTTPADYTGAVQSDYCFADPSSACTCSGSDGPPENCFTYPFVWGTICLEINTTTSSVESYTRSCAGSVTDQLIQTIESSSSSFTTDCELYGEDCQSDRGKECMLQLEIYGVFWSFLSDSQVDAACSEVSDLKKCIQESLVQCSPYFYDYTFAAMDSWIADFDCPGGRGGIRGSSSPPVIPVRTDCRVLEINDTLTEYFNAWYTYAMSPTADSTVICSYSETTEKTINDILESVTTNGACSDFADNIRKRLETQSLYTASICEGSQCHLKDALDCLDALDFYIKQNGLIAVPGSDPVPPEDAVRTPFCLQTKKTLTCLNDATVGCSDGSIAEAYARYSEEQNQTGIQCFTPCDSDPCFYGGLCKNSQDLQSFTCTCPPGYTGTNCEKGLCSVEELNTCYEGAWEALVSQSYDAASVGYCGKKDAAYSCFSQKSVNCPQTTIDIWNKTISDFSNALCSSGACTSAAVLSDFQAKFPTLPGDFWDTANKGLSSASCSSLEQVVLNCDGTLAAEYATLVSLFCYNATYSCDIPELILVTDDLQYALWLVDHKTKRRAPSPDEQQLNEYVPEKKDNNRCGCSHPDRGEREQRDHERRRNRDSKDRRRDHDDDGSQDTCWYIQELINATNQLYADCSPAYRALIENDLQTALYLSRGQCANPCDDNSCSYGSTCVPDGYGYTCDCMPGYHGPICDQPDDVYTCNVTAAVKCIKDYQTESIRLIQSTYDAATCSSLNELESCIVTNLMPCSNEMYFAALKYHLDFYTSLIDDYCSGSTHEWRTTSSCQMEAIAQCTLETSLEIFVPLPDSTFCGTLAEGVECSTVISDDCHIENLDLDLDAAYQVSAFLAYASSCSTPTCDVTSAVDCYPPLSDAINSNAAADSLCPTALSTSNCVSDYTATCEVNVKNVFKRALKSLKSRGKVDQKCINRCDGDPCSNGGTCKRDYISDAGYTCNCVAPFVPPNCLFSCDYDALQECSANATTFLSKIFDPCATKDCSEVTSLKTCFETKTGGCDSTLTNNVATLVSQLTSYQSSCTTTALDPSLCDGPCNVTTAESCADEYFSTILDGYTGQIGMDYVENCRVLNETKQCVQKSLSGCTNAAVTGAVDASITWISTLTVVNCDVTLPCQFLNAQYSLEQLISLVSYIEAASFLDDDLNQQFCSAIDDAQTAITDDLSTCPDGWYSNITDTLQNITAEYRGLCDPCEYHPERCSPLRGDGPGGNKTECDLNAAQACVDNFADFVNYNGYLGKEYTASNVGSFCDEASQTLQCIVDATKTCPVDPLVSNIYLEVDTIQAAVGWTCFGFCVSKPCGQLGVCEEAPDFPTDLPAYYTLYQYECTCFPGYGGPDCLQDTCDQSQIESCFVSTLEYLFAGDDSFLCANSSTLQGCVTSSLESCPTSTTNLTTFLYSSGSQSISTLICQSSVVCDFPSLLETPCAKAVSDLLQQGVDLWNKDLESIDLKYCQAWGDISAQCDLSPSSTFSGCYDMVTQLNYWMSYLCDYSYNGQCNLQELLNIVTDLEMYLFKKLEYVLEPPPISAFLPPPSTSKEFSIYALCPGQVYFDGNLVGEFDSISLTTFPYDTSIQIIAVSASGCEAEYGGFIASVTNGYLVSEQNWRCTSNAPPNNWVEKNFGDSAWDLADALNKNGEGSIGQVSGISDNAYWLSSTDNSAGDIYCRAFYGTRDLYITAFDSLNVYVNGLIVNSLINAEDPRTLDSVPLSSTTNIIAVEAIAGNGDQGAILASVDGISFFTNANWYCTNIPQYSDDWTTYQYDDSTWTNAAEIDNPDPTISFSTSQINSNAKWIWFPGSGASLYAHVYCRKKIVLPAAPTTYPPPPPTIDDLALNFCGDISYTANLTIDAVATCGDEWNSFFAEMTANFYAEYTLSITCANPCNPDPCYHNGVCHMLEYDYYCECQPGYLGTACEIATGECSLSTGLFCASQVFGASVLYYSNQFDYSIGRYLDSLETCLSVQLMQCPPDYYSDLYTVFDFSIEFLREAYSNKTSSQCLTDLQQASFNVMSQILNPSTTACDFLGTAVSSLCSITSCGDDTEISTDDLNSLIQNFWSGYNRQSCSSDCSTSKANDCLISLAVYYASHQTIDFDLRQLVTDTATCVSTNLQGCTCDIITDSVNTTLLVKLEKECFDVCSGNLCQNGATCVQGAGAEYTCNCASGFEGTYCEYTNGCNLEKVRDCLTETDITDALLHPCAAQDECQKTSQISQCVTTNTQTCNDGTKTVGTDKLKSSTTSLSCPSTQPATCDNNWSNGCQYDTIIQTVHDFLEIVLEEFTQFNAPNYFRVCTQWNTTKITIDSLKTTYCDGYQTEITNTETFLQQFTTNCDSAICFQDRAVDTLAKLQARTNPFAENPPLGMDTSSREDLCSDVNQKVTSIFGNLQDCDQTVIDTFTAEVENAWIPIAYLCPLPCFQQPCSLACDCVQDSPVTYTCAAPAILPGFECATVPSCNLEAGLQCSESLFSFLFANNVYHEQDLATVPASFYAQFCQLLDDDVTCIASNVADCNEGQSSVVWNVAYSLQTLVNASCIRACQSDPCQNFGQCTDDTTDLTKYTCTCPEGYNGINCETALCAKSAIDVVYLDILQYLFVSNVDQLCNLLPNAVNTTEIAVSQCPAFVQELSIDLQTALVEALNPICTANFVCDFENITVTCFGGHFEETSNIVSPEGEQQLCTYTDDIAGCLADYEGPGCSLFIEAVIEIFGYVCTSSSCSFSDLYTYLTDLQQQAWLASQVRSLPAAPADEYPASVKGLEDYINEGVDTTPPTSEQDVCNAISNDIKSAFKTVQDCGGNWTQFVEETVNQVKSDYNVTSYCSNPCDPNPCMYEGVCYVASDGIGAQCDCLDGFYEPYCSLTESVPGGLRGASHEPEGDSSDGITTIQSVDMSSTNWQASCLTIDDNTNTIAKDLLPSIGIYQDLFQLAYPLFQEFSDACNGGTVSCELKQLFSWLQDLINNLLTLPDPNSDDKDDVTTKCGYLKNFAEKVFTINVTCPDSTELSSNFEKTAFGIYDRQCSNESSSLTTIVECLKELYKLSSDPDTNGCQEINEKQRCVTDGSSTMLEPVKTLVDEALVDALDGKQCRDSCGSYPCQNGGTCSQVGQDDYSCSCVGTWTGRNCDQTQSSCECQGDTHCTTFDSYHMDYQGTCRFLLAESNCTGANQFAIYGRSKNLNGNNYVAYLYYVEVHYGGRVFRLESGLVDRVRVMFLYTPSPYSVFAYLPLDYPDFEIYNDGRYVVYETTFGLKVGISDSYEMYIRLPSSLLNCVTGFCGDFNNDPGNDNRLSDGTTADPNTPTGIQVGNSYIEYSLPDPDGNFTDCSPSSPPTCTPARDSSNCDLIASTSGPFQTCINVLGSTFVNQFRLDCIYDVEHSCDDPCVMVGSFADLCFKNNVTVDWRTTAGCPFNCTVTDSTWQPGLSPPCIPTCSDQNALVNCTDTPLQDVCQCAPGKVVYQGACIDPSQCPCIDDDGIKNEVGDSWCGNNTRYVCYDASNTKSKEVASCAAPESKVCGCHGDAHCDTFDGFHMNYNGVCKFLLVELKDDDLNTIPLKTTFSVYGRNMVRPSWYIPYVSWMYYVEVHYCGYTVRLEKPTDKSRVLVKINGVQFNDTVNVGCFKIEYIGHKVNYTADFGMVVSYSNNWQMAIYMPTVFKNRVRGFCGNFDETKSNDKILSDGTLPIPGGSANDAAKQIGDSWIVVNDDDTEFAPCQSENVSEPTCADTDSRCAALTDVNGFFKDCIFSIGYPIAQKFQADCNYDYSYMCNGTVVCQVLETFAKECQDSYSNVDGWRDTFNCPLTCGIQSTTPVTGLYAPCLPTCGNPTADLNCDIPPQLDVCTCPLGQVLFAGECIDKSSCPCIDDDGRQYQVGDVWVNDACTIESSCTGPSTIERRPTFSCIPDPRYNYTTHFRGSSSSSSLITLRLDSTVFVNSKSYSSISISQSGYVQFGSSVSITNFHKLDHLGYTILAPLFTRQDSSCSGSNIYTKEYTASGTEPERAHVFASALKDVQKLKYSISSSLQSVVVVTWENMLPYNCSYYLSHTDIKRGSYYQLIIVSDSQTSYSIFNYYYVDVKYQLTDVFSGFTDKGPLIFSSIYSGTQSMQHFEEIDPDNTNSVVPGRWVYPLSPTQPSTDPCLVWAQSAVDLSTYSSTLDACPCNAIGAALDPRYHFTYIDWFRLCFATNRLNRLTGYQDIASIQVCCYDPFSQGALYTTPPFAGYPVVTDTSGAVSNDSTAFQTCCIQSPLYCSQFTSRRPIATCNAYTDPIEALMWGDPHFRTLDNHPYTFNYIGEFTMIKTTDNSFAMQARLAQYVDENGVAYRATIFSAFVAQETNYSRVQVELDSARTGLVLTIDGTQTTLNSGQSYYKSVYIVGGSNQINVTFPGGCTFSIGVGVRTLTLLPIVPGRFWGKTSGLLGTFNGNPSDDLTRPDGTVVQTTSSNQEIATNFGSLWRITQSESLFTYPAGKTTADFTDQTFVPYFDPPCDTIPEQNAGKAVCGVNADCYFDYCVTKNAQVANSTITTANLFDRNKQILETSAPKLAIFGVSPNANGQYVVSATVNLPLTLRVVAVNRTDVKFYMAGNISLQAGVSLDSVTGQFSWTPRSLDLVEVSFIAVVNSNGAVSSKLQVVVTLCSGCNNNGKCNFASYQQMGSTPGYQLADCICDVGWTGSNCSAPYNACITQQCGVGNGAACVPLSPAVQKQTGLTYNCRSCSAGYSTDQCTDVNECDLHSSKCTQICTNNIGSYSCSCWPGYRLSSDQFTCTDIDECKEGTSNCTQVCTNGGAGGNYTCSCNPGYNYIGGNCTAATQCATSNSCSQLCSVINGIQTCNCNAGYVLSSDRHTCNDVNECSDSTLNKCNPSTTCANTLGSYQCLCPAGQEVGPDQRTCQACQVGHWGPNCQNTCSCGLHVQRCDPVTGCTVCISGWTGDNCNTDIDECALNTYTCPANSYCANTIGSYACPCNPGKTPSTDGTTCLGDMFVRFYIRLDVQWSDTYADMTQSITQILKTTFETQLMNRFMGLSGLQGVTIENFFKSSLGVQFIVKFNYEMTDAQRTVIGKYFLQQLEAHKWQLTVISIPWNILSIPDMLKSSNATIPAGDPCDPDVKKCDSGKGETCASEGGSIPKCLSPPAQVTPPTDTTPLIIGLSVGLGGLAILAVLAIILVYCKLRHRSTKHFDSTYELSDGTIHKYDSQPTRFHPNWLGKGGYGYDQTDS